MVEKRQFDPWGAIVKVQNGAGTNLTKLTFFDRGYTGHEHLESVGLINMNGRVYDPALHRFLQADSMVQDPYNTQNYNRYGYCLNNPLKYTDVSGEDFGLTFAISMGVALAVYFGDAIINDKPVTFRGIASTVVVTAVSAGFSYGIGTAATHINNFFVRASAQALAHGITQGGMTVLQGGKFWSGFAAGAVSSIMSSVWQGGNNTTKIDGVRYSVAGTGMKGLGDGFVNKTVGTMFFGTISGGAAASVSGGNFWQGAVTGLIVSGLNHGLHDTKENTLGTESSVGDDKPYVSNETNGTIHYKPETYNPKYPENVAPLGSGQKTYDLIDGINVKGKVYKVTDGYTKVIVSKNFKVYLDYSKSSLIDAGYALIKSGRVKRSDFAPTDHGWDGFFKIKN